MACLVPVAAWILVSGLDDLFITLVYLLTSHRRVSPPGEAALRRKSERPIAILIPLWREHGVIGRMLVRNVGAIRYRNYHIFAGVYPNDTPTLHAVAREARRHPRVHMAVCPHDGPTSKGDCLNWIYRRMQEYERRRGMRFRVVMTHDAEDVIHPESLRLINWFSRRHAMVQIPVLPLPTPNREWTHGLYCDEFAEYQMKDIPVRQRLGGFLPANGVGTGFAREAVERLAAIRGGRPFDPVCLTEDYETGFEIHAMGYSQIFVPVAPAPSGAPDICATREFFPRTLKASISQRCRWVTGISLQGWERHPWSASPRQIYWFWRDRKGLVGNLLTPIANLLMFYGLARYPHVGNDVPAILTTAFEAALVIALLQMGIRVQSAARIYGWRFAAGVPYRILWGNFVNCAATAAALREFWTARWKGRGLAWRKTEHTYPMPQPAYGQSVLSLECSEAGEPQPYSEATAP